jgi:hypothetical protein
MVGHPADDYPIKVRLVMPDGRKAPAAWFRTADVELVRAAGAR